MVVTCKKYPSTFSNINNTELKTSRKDFNLLEIKNDSVFCVCLLGDFVRSLHKFIDDYLPDIVIIEASGLSDSTSIYKIVSAASLFQKIDLASNWCIDAQNFAKVGGIKQRVSHQLRMADVVVVNKTDLVEGEFPAIEQEIKTINPFAIIQESCYCDIDFEFGNSAIKKFYFDEVKTMPYPILIRWGLKF